MSLSAVEQSGDSEEEFSEASKFGSRWWYYIAAYPIAGLFLTVVTSLLSPFIPAAIAPITQALAAITGFIYVLGFPVLGIALFLDARGIRASPLDWSPNPYFYGGTALVLLGASGSNGPEKQSLATKFVGEAASMVLPLLAIALCLYYLSRRHQHLGES
ncbi:hypothetical protein ACFFQF_09385 [Haladaptatus pallidirubidus]|uniref:Uncharacterized protein n=1 Tax=Haladaptatus pallidirubidus TaxID=1008152 RepID=A0AAV3UG54_9EURY|nr:hypothetical protein [Haladaptatus pallidirubidus]